MRHAAQSDFDRYGDLLFDFLGGPPRKKSDHLNLCIGHIRECFHRKRSERGDPASDEQRYQQNQEKTLIESEGNETFDHDALLSWKQFTEQQDSACDHPIIDVEALINDGVLPDF